MYGYASRCSNIELLKHFRNLIYRGRLGEGFRTQGVNESAISVTIHLSLNLSSYLSVKLASSIGSSSNRSGRLCFRSSLGEASSSSSSIFLLKTSCLSSSCDFLGNAVEATVLARFLFGVAGDDDEGSYRVKDLVDNGDGLLLTVVIVCVWLDIEHKTVTTWVRSTVQDGICNRQM